MVEWESDKAAAVWHVIAMQANQQSVMQLHIQEALSVIQIKH
jgi:hypothetical protein